MQEQWRHAGSTQTSPDAYREPWDDCSNQSTTVIHTIIIFIFLNRNKSETPEVAKI